MSLPKEYLCIDLKSFYASVECVARKLDPLDAMLVVADESRTDKTICLAVSPALKSIGLPGRPRLFEVVQKAKEANELRKAASPNHQLEGSSCSFHELETRKEAMLEYIVAKPRMRLYMETSTKIFNIYRRYVSEEDIHVYSIDEVFIDLTAYLSTYQMTSREMAMKLIHEVLDETGITATAGIGTNLYLAKIAMDIVAKQMKADEDGVRIAYLDEKAYREQLWAHKPLTDFWRIGKGTAARLKRLGMETMGDIARCSLGARTDARNEDCLYKQFGVNAELLIDHAWGYEPVTIQDIKAYIPESRSVSMGQVLSCPYSFEQASLIVREMADQLSLTLAQKGVMTDQIVLYICYDSDSLSYSDFSGDTDLDMYGRAVPKPSHGSADFECSTSSTSLITEKVIKLYQSIASRSLLIRRINLSANHLSATVIHHEAPKQLNLFEMDSAEKAQEQENLQVKERKRQEAILQIREKFGKNAILKGVSYEEFATARERNVQVGGHKA